MDDSSFIDAQGYSCRGWTLHGCYDEQYDDDDYYYFDRPVNYSSADMAAVRGNCPLTCGSE